MPQMMPMYWLMLTLMTMFLLMIIINFFYFFLMYIPTLSKNNINKMNNFWIWKW